MLLAAAQLGRKGIGLFGDVDFLEQIHGHFRGVCPGLFPDQLLGQIDVVAYRHVGEQVELLKDHAHFFADFEPVFPVVIQRNAIHHNGAAVNVLQSVQASQKCGFARSRRANDHNHFAATDMGGEITQGHNTIGEGFVDIVHGDDVITKLFVLHAKRASGKVNQEP